MCGALAARHHRVDLVYVSPGDFLDDWREVASTMIHIGGTLPSSQAPLSTSIEVLRAVRAAQHLRPDIIYVFRYLDLPFATALGRLVRAPVVLHLCLPQPNHLPFIVRRSLTNVTMTLSVSYDTAEQWWGTGLPADSVVVVHTGIDMDTYVPAPTAARLAVREVLGIDPDEFMAVYAGRISPVKGLDILIKAAKTVARVRPGFRLVVVGGPSVGDDPSESSRFEDELRTLAGSLDVLWLGPRRDVLPLIQAADVAVAPSLWPEPFSRSVIEPLACEVPVIASDVGGNPEIMTGWLGRFLVPPGDVGALADSIISLDGWRISDPELGRRCRAAVEQRLALDREVNTVEAALASVVRNPVPDPLDIPL
jgi:glycosyltransferase involved in cell wall biosynthesis